MSTAGGIEGNELLVVAMLRDELSAGLDRVAGALDTVAKAEERVAAASVKTTAGLDRTAVAAEGAGRKLTAADLASGRFGRTLEGAGLTVGRTAAGLAIAGTASVYMAAKFDASMTRIQTQAGAGADEVRKMTSAVLAMAGPLAQSPEALAIGLYHIESAGFRGAVALNTLHAAAMLASIGNAQLGDTTQAMIASVASGIKGVHGAIGAAALLNKTVGIGDMTMQQLAGALATGILPSARSAGLSFQDVAAALATITDNASPANQAATRLRMTFALLSTQSPTAAAALGSVGIKANELGHDLHQPQGLLVALVDLKAHLEASGKSATAQNQVMERAFGGGRTSAALLTLMEELDRLKSKYAELGTSSEQQIEFTAAWAVYTDTLSYKWHSFTAQLQSSAITIGQDLTPAAKDLLDTLSSGLHIIGATASALNSHRAALIAVALVITILLLPALTRMGVALASDLWETFALKVLYAKEAVTGFVGGMSAATIGVAALATVAIAVWEIHARSIAKAKSEEDAYAASLNATTSSLHSQVNAETLLRSRLEARVALLKSQFPVVAGAASGGIARVGSQELGPGAASGTGAAQQTQIQNDPHAAENLANLKKAEAAAFSMRQNEAQLTAQFGLSRTQVESLASANGIDLTGSYQQVSNAMNEVQRQALLSHNANAVANADISQMASSATSASDAVTALSDSLARMAGNHIAVRDAQIELRNNEVALAKALHESGGQMDINNAKGRAAASAFDQMANSVITLTTASATASSASLPATVKALKQGIDMLAPFAKGNNAAAREVSDLRKELTLLQQKIDALHGKTVHIGVTSPQVVHGLSGGDTAGPRGVAGGNVFDFHQRTARGNQKITSGVRFHNLGSPYSDHATGRAIDVTGSNLPGYARAARAAGGFAEFHGAGDGRHLHVAMGDTATPRAPGGGSGGGTSIDVGGVTVVVGDIGHLSEAQIRALVADGVHKGVRQALEHAAVPADTFGAH